MKPWSLIFALALPGTVLAQSYECAGQSPEWQLELDLASARVQFPTTTQMEVMLSTPAEGKDWPIAYTLVGERDTAIALLERETCGSDEIRAHILTQRGQTPILLTGCCKVRE